jgi:hypothetical protein
MSAQSYANHAHQPVLTTVAAGFWLLALAGVTACWLGYDRWGNPLAMTGFLLSLLCLISISRVYTTRLQDRIILLEERLRAERLLTAEQLARWPDLHVKQVVALRFASDAELPALYDRALADGLTPDAIKRAVTAWREDRRRT